MIFIIYIYIYTHTHTTDSFIEGKKTNNIHWQIQAPQVIWSHNPNSFGPIIQNITGFVKKDFYFLKSFLYWTLDSKLSKTYWWHQFVSENLILISEDLKWEL